VVRHVAWTHGPQSDRMLQNGIIHSLVDDGLTEIRETMIKYRTLDTLNLVVILKSVRCPDEDSLQGASRTAEHVNARKQILAF
jgi:hypothetical protein